MCFSCVIQPMNAYPLTVLSACFPLLQFILTIHRFIIHCTIFRLDSSCLKLFVILFRSEQDKEPEHEDVSEAAGPGPVEESVDDSMYLWRTLELSIF